MSYSFSVLGMLPEILRCVRSEDNRKTRLEDVTEYLREVTSVTGGPTRSLGGRERVLGGRERVKFRVKGVEEV